MQDKHRAESKEREGNVSESLEADHSLNSSTNHTALHRKGLYG